MLGSIYAMVAVALTLSIGVLRFLNFSIPGLFMIGGMAMWALVRAGMPWPLAAGAALIAGAVGSLVVERFTWRWMRSAQDFVPLVSSMAFLLLFGVDLNHIVPVVFVIGGLFAAFAGLIFALNYRQVHPFMGEVVGLKGISAMIVGGMGNVWGSIAGGLIIGLVEVMSIGYFGAD